MKKNPQDLLSRYRKGLWQNPMPFRIKNPWEISNTRENLNKVPGEISDTRDKSKYKVICSRIIANIKLNGKKLEGIPLK